MDPVTIGLAVAAGLGALYKGFSSSASSLAQARVAQANAELLGKQAQVEELGAGIALAKGGYQQYKTSEQVSHVLAAQPGRFIASGLSPTAPTPLMAAAYSAQQGEADLEIIRASSALEAAAAKTRAANIYGQAYGQAAQATALESRAFADRVSGFFGAGTSFLTAARGQFKDLGASDAMPGYYGGSPETNPLLVPI